MVEVRACMMALSSGEGEQTTGANVSCRKSEVILTSTCIGLGVDWCVFILFTITLSWRINLQLQLSSLQCSSLSHNHLPQIYLQNVSPLLSIRISLPHSFAARIDPIFNIYRTSSVYLFLVPPSLLLLHHNHPPQIYLHNVSSLFRQDFSSTLFWMIRSSHLSHIVSLSFSRSLPSLPSTIILLYLTKIKCCYRRSLVKFNFLY